jgi:hypothetical protein
MSGKTIYNYVFFHMKGELKKPALKDLRLRGKKRKAGNAKEKRGFNTGRCTWKGWKHYRQKVYWSVIGYNIKVMTAAVIAATL